MPLGFHLLDLSSRSLVETPFLSNGAMDQPGPSLGNSTMDQDGPSPGSNTIDRKHGHGQPLSTDGTMFFDDDGNDQAVTYSQFACIGAGFSAVALGATLKRWHGITDICFFERQETLGGVWLANRYPGCASDVPSVLYCLSFAPNKNWTRLLSSHEDVCTYMRRVAAEYGLLGKMCFGASVERARWVPARRRWRIGVRIGAGGPLRVHESQFLYSAVGHLSEPRAPDLPGLATFDGPVVHAARWRGDVRLDGRRVVVVGNGCSATQLVPAIRGAAAQVTQFVRGRHWILPGFRLSERATAAAQLLCRRLPGFFAAFRLLAFAATENDMRAVYMTVAAAAFRQSTMDYAQRYVRAAAPAQYHDMLLPDFQLGCKRTILDDTGYLASLHAANVAMTDAPILEVLPRGVRSSAGFTPADVIVLATGFETNRFLAGVDIVGAAGTSAADHWKALGGPGAYNTTCLHGFPNFFMILGPNTGSGATSALIASENAINYSLRVIKRVLDGRAVSVDVKRDAEQRYVDRIQEKLQNTVWSSGCNSWYNRAPGARNGMNYPFSQLHFWWSCLFPTYSDFAYEPATPAVRRYRRSETAKTVLRGILILASIVVAVVVSRCGGSFRIL